MDITQLKQSIKRELPAIMRDDPEIRQLILNLSRNQFADKQETESRFDRVLDELRRDREDNTRKWAENQEVLRQMREDSNKKWEAQEAKWAENQEAQDKKWAENQAVIDKMLKKYNSDIGALGARWGMRSEHSFRDALASILERSFAVEVLNINEYDDEGYVFGHPDQIEMDIIIKNGLLIICEIKSSTNRGAMYLFNRKVEFYEARHNKQANRKLVISPWVTERAKQVAEKLGIEVYSYADEVKSL